MSTTYGILYKNGINYSHDTAESISYSGGTNLKSQIDNISTQLVPTYTSAGNTFLRGDGTWSTAPNTTYPVGNGGLVKKLTGATDRYFRGDGVWMVPGDETYGVVTTADDGLVPSGGTNATYLRADGNWETPPNTTYPIGNGGLVRKLTNNTSYYFRGDGQWTIPGNTTYGTVSTAANGLVVKLPNSSAKYFRGDGTWQTPPDSNQNVAQMGTSNDPNNYALLASNVIGSDDTTTAGAIKLDAYYGAKAGDLVFFKAGIGSTTSYPVTSVRFRFDQLYVDNGVLVVNSQANQKLDIAGSNEADYKLFIGVRDSTHTIGSKNNGNLRCGTGSYKWYVFYAVNGTVQTSDRNQKTNIEFLDGNKVKQFIMDLKPVSYKLKNLNENDNHDRTHYGLIAQDVEETMNKMGMTALDFAGFCKDQKMGEIKDEDAPVIKNPDGTYVLGADGEPYKPMKQVPIEGEYTYGLRYEEFLSPLIKMVQLQEQEIQSRKLKIEELKSRLDKLENK